MSKVCFVTVGATAPFDALVHEVLSESFLQALKRNHYTNIVVQHGREGATIDEFGTNASDIKAQHGIDVEGFDFKTDGLAAEFRQTKACKDDKREEGVVVSHAGSGTILSVLRLGVPLIVVPNPQLMDNHQDELARALSSQGYVIHGKLGGLAASVDSTEEIWQQLHAGLRAYRQNSGGLSRVMEDELF